MPELLQKRGQAGCDADYVHLRARSERDFRAWFPALRDQDHDFYNDAWAELLGHEGLDEDVEACLRRTLWNRGLDEMRRRARRPALVLDASDPDVADEAFDRTEEDPEEHALIGASARDVQAILLERLSRRQQQVLRMHWGWGLRVKDVAHALSLSERTVRRELEEAAAIATENASWLTPCSEGGRRSLIKAYVLGLLSPQRTAKAVAHLEECASCRALRNQMEETLRGAAALIPAGVVAEPPATDHGLLARMAEAAEGARAQLVDLAGSTKQQAVTLVSRGPGDAASQVAAGGGLRGSGAMLATVATCAVVGGGTVTYCAVEGLPEPVRDVLPGGAGKDEREKSKEPAVKEVTPGPELPAPPIVTPPPPPPVTDAPVTPARSRPVPTPKPPEPPPAEQEFGFEQQAAPSSTAPQSSTPAPAPAPAPAEQEFGFEQ